MAESSAISDDRPSSPDVPLRTGRRERRKSGSKSPAGSDSHELKSPPAPKKRVSQSERLSRFVTGISEEPIEDQPPPPEFTENNAPPPMPGSTKEHGQKVEIRRPRLTSHADGEDEGAGRKDLNIMLHDITQSMWIEDPIDHSSEKVYLTIEAAALEEMLTIDPAFAWM
jgi:hypothetical protein